ncbi:MAG: hypothetical protein LBL94_00650 [Prevotellaceae bacterium]|nr:hypothetical protein [Prevotellaceae bacterium]
MTVLPAASDIKTMASPTLPMAGAVTVNVPALTVPVRITVQPVGTASTFTATALPCVVKLTLLVSLNGNMPGWVNARTRVMLLSTVCVLR